MTETITWITDNAGNIVSALTAVVAAASAIAAFFKKPEDKDPKWLQVAYSVTNWLAINVNKAKNKED